MDQQSERIEQLIEKLEASADPGSLAIARDLVEAVMALYSEGFSRVTDILARQGETGRQMLEELSRDELVGNLLAVNGLHPADLESRVRQALQKVRRRLGSRGTVELVALEGDVVHLRVQSSSGSLKALVEEAMYEAAPDLTGIVIDEPGAAAGFVPLEKLLASAAPANGNGVRS